MAGKYQNPFFKNVKEALAVAFKRLTTIEAVEYRRYVPLGCEPTAEESLQSLEQIAEAVFDDVIEKEVKL